MKDAITIMISFGMLLVAILNLVVVIVVAINRNTKK
ncbi:putative holin-like toxin [Fontibacillus panacisegetis]